MYSIRTFDCALGAIAAIYALHFSRQVPEIQFSLMVIAAEVVIGQETHYIRNGHAFGALAAALIAHPAVVGPDLFIQHI
jgi:hypothetical protein